MAANAARESVSKNNLIIAREAVKRFPALKDLCQKFIRTFERETDRPDAKFGKRKYKALLQQAANEKLETVFVDLGDVQEFCEREIANPDQDIMETHQLTKITLQQSIEQFIQDISTNAYRFMRYFYEACDAELPEREVDLGGEGNEAKDIIRRWRERNAKESGGEGMPLRLKNDFEVRFRPSDDFKSVKLREISASTVGALVQIDCVVVRTTQVKPKAEVVTYHCELCGSEIFMSVESEQYTPLRECPSQRCRDNKVSGKLRQNNRTSKFGKYQEMKVQEMSAHVPVGGVPRSLKVVLRGDLTRTVLPGDAITLSGVFAPATMPWYRARSAGTMQEMYLDAHCVRKHKSGYNEEQEDANHLSRRLDEAQQEGNLYERCSKSIAPEIFGHDNVKKAMLLVLIGSFTKTMKDGMRIRGDIHSLFMGDPGVAKSQLLKQVCNIAPRSVYTTGKGSSGVGLTASVIRDNATGEVTLEGGALVIADMGVCCIDEFDKMDESDRTAIHEVMEQQTVSIAKSGITTTLNARTTVLAAANPVFGRYNPYKSPVENIDLPASLLSRFDLLFLLLDTVDAEKDKNLAMHVCKVHTNFSKSDAEKKDQDPAPDGSGASGDLYSSKPFEANFLRNYVRKARTFEPLIDDSIQPDIVNAYVNIRDEETKGDVDSRKSYTTPRTLLAILRLSQAHARARFSERVERQDFDEAMRLMKASKESVELSAPSKKNVNPLDVVYDIVADLSRRADVNEGWVDMAHVTSMAGHKALNSEQVMEAVENWEGLSVLLRNPEKTLVKFLVPPA
jgi:DNA replication licensing factor MCM7